MACSQGGKQPDRTVQFGAYIGFELNAYSRAPLHYWKADTLIIASYVDRKDGSRQVDVSHKGGEPGSKRRFEMSDLGASEGCPACS